MRVPLGPVLVFLCLTLCTQQSEATSTRSRLLRQGARGRIAADPPPFDKSTGEGEDKPQGKNGFLLPVDGFYDEAVKGLTTNTPIRNIDKGYVPDLGNMDSMPNRLFRVKPNWLPTEKVVERPHPPAPHPEDLALKRPVLLNSVIRTWANSQ